MDSLLPVTAEIIDRSTGARHQVPASQIALDAPGIVVLTIQRADIDHLERSGQDLVIHLVSGETITIAGFYADPPHGPGSELVLQGPDGSLWYWDQSSGGHSLNFLQISDIESLLHDEDDDNGLLPILLGLGGLGLAGAVALANDDPPNPPGEDDTEPPSAPTAALADDTGEQGDGRTSDATVNVNGLEQGASWEYSTDGGQTWHPGTGTSFELPPGEYDADDVQVRQTDEAGNTSAPGLLGPVIVDTSPPAAPVEMLENDTGTQGDGITTDGTIVVSGLEPDASWEYSTDGGANWIPGTGTSFELPTGEYDAGDVQVRQTDAAGNTGAPGLLGPLVIDTGIPAAPTATLENDTGTPSDGISSDGTVEVSGLEPSATWEYSTNGGVSWTTGTGTSFELVPGTYDADDVQVRQTDTAGNTSDEGLLGPVTIDASAPAAPTLSLENDTGTLGSDGITSDGTVDVGGIEPGATWEYSTDGGTTWDPGTGTSFELAPGTYDADDVQVRQTDAAGNTSDEGLLGVVTIDTTGPSSAGATAVILPIATDDVVNAAEASGDIPITVTLTGIPADAVSTTVTISVGSVDYPASDNGDGTWTADVPGSIVAGTNSATATAVFTDAAGNDSAPVTDTRPYTIDADLPPAPVPELENDTGTPGDGITSDGTIEVSGIEPGATWEYSTDGGASWNPGSGTSFELGVGAYDADDVQVRQTDTESNTSGVGLLGPVTIDTTGPSIAGASATISPIADDDIVNAAEAALDVPVTVTLAGVPVDAASTTVTINVGGTDYPATASGGGTWTANVPGSVVAANSSATATAIFTDLAGNASSPVTDTRPYAVDTSGPAAPAVALENDTGTSGDGISSDGTVEVSGIEPGAIWEYSADGGTTWDPGTGTSFELTPGTYDADDVQVRQTDAAGNISDEGLLGPVTIDTGIPAAPTLALENDTGTPSDGISSDGTVEVSGIEPSATWEYSTDGGTGWTPGTGSSFELSPGTYDANDVQVRQTDAAGNTSDEGLLGPVTIDASAPAAPTLALENDTGTLGSDGISSDGTVDVSGLEPGATWEYSTDGGTTWDPGTGTSFELPPDTYDADDVQVRQTDAAGNTSDEALLGPVTIDTTGPSTAGASVTVSPVAGDDVVNAAEAALDVPVTVTIAGVPADAATTAVTINVGGTDYAATNNGDGTWTANVPGSAVTANTSVTATAIFTDTAGNDSAPVIDTRPYTVDTGIPAAPTAALENDTGTPGDGISSDGTVDVTGLEPSATWEYSTNGGVSWTTGTGTSFELAPGTYDADDVQVRQTDTAGNTSAEGLLGPVTIDASAPAAPTLALENDTGTLGSDGISSDGTVDVNGLEPGATWEYSTDGGTTWDPGTGTSFELAPGTYDADDVQVRQTDTAGNTSDEGLLGVVTIDTTGPSSAGATAVILPIATDDVVNAAEATLDVPVTVTLTGVPVDAANTIVTVNVGGTDYPATDNGDGTWTADVPGSVVAANTSVNATAIFTDAAGNASAPVDDTRPYTVDTDIPAAPTATLENDTGTPGDGITSDGTIEVGGIEPGATWEYSTDGGTTWDPGTATSFELLPGTYDADDVQVRQTDAAGNTSDEGLLGPVTIDTTGPSTAGATAALSPITGDDVVNAAEASGDIPIIVTLTGIPADAVSTTVIINVGSVDYPASDNGDGTWTADVPGSIVAGTNSATATAVFTDAAGNDSAPVTDTRPYTIDADLPPAPVPELENDTGTPGDGITSDGTIEVSGIEPGATWEYSTDGGASWNPGSGTSFELGVGAYDADDVQVRQTDTESNTSGVGLLGPVTIDTTGPSIAGASATISPIADDDIVNAAEAALDVPVTVTLAGVPVDAASTTVTINVGGTDYPATASGGGTWTANVPGSVVAANSSATATAIFTDLAGNASSPVTDTRPYAVDTSGPAAPAVALENDTGTSGDGISSDGTVEVSGIEPGAIWEYSADGGTTWDPGTGTSFELTPGTYDADDVQVRQTDAAGNISDEGLLGPVTIDASAPAAPTLALENDTGTLGSDGISSDGTVDVSGLEPGATWEYSTDGGTTWDPGTGTSFELPPDTYDADDVQVRQTDAAGNTSDEALLGPVTIDTTGPSTAGASVTVSPVAGDDVVNAAEAALDVPVTVTIAGVPADAATTAVTINVGGTDYAATNNGDGTWTANVPGSAVTANTSVTATAIFTDTAGNDSAPVIDTRPYTVDTGIPAAPTAALENDTGTPGDGISSDGTVDVTGLEPSATWEYSTNGGVSWTTGTGTSFELAPGTYDADDVQVRQTDTAGNTSAEGLLGPVTIDASAPAAPTLALENDTGTLGSDGISSDGTVDVNGLEPGATWEYSTDGGTTWDPGTGTSFELAPGTYDADDVQVRQTDTAGNTSDEGLLGVVTIDTTGPSSAGATAVILPIATDDVVNAAEATLDVPVTVTLTGVPVDAANTIVTVNVGGTDYPATDNGDGTWTADVPGSVVAANTSVNATAIFTDAAGNASAPVDDTRPYTVDTDIPAAPTATLENDTGTPGDGITSDGTIEVGGIEPGATWEYSTDGGTTWDPGTATSFELLPGTYDADDVQVRQTDAAGNTSDEGLLGPVTVDVSLDAVNDSTTLDMGAVSEVDYAPQVTSDVEVIGLLESNEGADASAAVTVQADRSGELRIEISQTALVAVGDAYRLDVIDSDGNIVYQGATATSPLVGQVAGLQVLGLTGDNTLVATVTGLPPGTYSVVIHNDSSALTDLLDTDGGGVSVQELGDAGVVVGADNQSVVLTAVSNALGPLGPAAVLLLDPVLTGLNGLPVTGIVGPLTGILNTVGFLGSVDDVVDAIATALLSNTLTLLQETTITTTLTEYEFATETVTGNVITGDAGLGVDDIGAGATITQVVNSDGTIAPVPAGGSVNIAGEYGELTLNSDGSYTYNAYGAPMSVGEADVFTYTLSDGGASDTATLTITLDGEAVVAAGDSASASFVWENVEEVVTDSHNLSGALTAQTTNSPTFTLDAATLASGTVVVSAGLAGVAMSGNAVLQEETSPGVWTNVPGTTDSFSVVIAVLGAELASIDIGALTLDPGNYRVHVTLNGSLAALAINVATDLTLTHTDQFVLDQATGATGNVLDNDAAGATTTELQVQNDADLYVGGPVTVQGTYGTLTVQADGSYSYVPDTGVAYFDTPQVDSFNYQLVHPNGQISQAVLDVTVEPSGAGIAGFAGFSLMSFGFGDDTIPLGDFSAAPDSVLSSEAPDLSGIVEPPASDDSTSVDALLDQFIDTQDAGTEPDSTSSGAPDTSPSPEPTMEDPLGYLTPVPIDDQHLQHPTVV